MTRLVAFCGLAGSGKDTSGDFLVKNDNYVKLACADPLKRICQQVYDFTDEQLWGPSSERNKPDMRYLRRAAYTQTQTDDGGNEIDRCEFPAEYLTPRYALQQLGTEWGRDCYPNTWIDLALRTAMALRTTGMLRSLHFRYSQKEGLVSGNVPFGPKIGGVAITDVRFLNEVLAINNAGGEVYLLTRGLGLEGAAGQHKSETEMRSIPKELFKGIIDNRDWSLTQLEAHMLHITRD